MAKITGRWKLITDPETGKVTMKRNPRALGTSAKIRQRKSKKQKPVRPGLIR